MSKISKEQEYKINANVLDHLINHLRDRSDVQNIDLMNLSGFCRNCLSKWYVKYAKEENYDLDYEESRKIIYGMAYSEWKSKYQVSVEKFLLNAGKYKNWLTNIRRYKQHQLDEKSEMIFLDKNLTSNSS